MLKKIFCNEKVLRYLGILFIGFLFPIISNADLKENPSPYLANVFFSTFYAFISWNVACAIITFFRKHYGNYNQTNLRLKFEIPSIIISMFIINIWVAMLIDNYIFATIFNNTILKCDPSRLACLSSESLKIPILASILCLGILAIYESAYIYQQLQKSILEAQKFQTESIKSQFEVLKNQIDPHFLFNSLNTLASVIEENPQVAVHFAEKLSQVYRYILQNKDKELVRLDTELKFVESYIFLLKIRFEQNLIVNFEVKEEFYNTKIPPLSLQILVENAIKHNIISAGKPLTIEIFVNDLGFLAIKNNLQIKNSVQHSNKIGLENVIKRYQYFTQEAVQIIKNAQLFEVQLPLIKL